jgi:hypothetical protein
VTERKASPTPEQLQAEVEQARDDLVASMSALRTQTTPAALMQRGKNAVTEFFVDEFGGIRPERVALAAGVVVTLVVLRRWRRSRRQR